MSLVRNEQAKLTANRLNAISAASIAVGGFAQLAPILTGNVAGAHPIAAGIFTVVWIAVGLGLHLAARRVLTGLRE